MINPVLLRQFGDPVFLAGELTDLFKHIKTFDEDKYESLHNHNKILGKIYSIIGENDTKFRYEVAKLIYMLGATNGKKEEKRRTVGTGEGRRTVGERASESSQNTHR